MDCPACKAGVKKRNLNALLDDKGLPTGKVAFVSEELYKKICALAEKASAYNKGDENERLG